MEFGVPKEVRDLEMRVGLTPPGVSALVKAGHTVYVEKGAGAGAGFSDAAYQEAGAQTVYSAAEAYGRADAVVKVTRPAAQEHSLFREGQVIGSFLSLQTASLDLLEALTSRKITAIAYEMIQEDDGAHPVMAPTSEAAGRLAPIIAGELLMSRKGGRGVLLCGVPGVPPAAVVIVGGGTLGTNAARAFLGMGAQVTVLDTNPKRLQYLDELFSCRVTTMFSNEYNLKRVAKFADVLVGCASITGHRTPILITREMIGSMRPGSVFIDYAIDSGGSAETSRPTTLRDQTYVTEGVIHYCVPNVTALVARTASYALTNAALPYLLGAAECGLPKAFNCNLSLMRGVNLYQGKLVNPDMAATLGREVEKDALTGGTL